MYLKRLTLRGFKSFASATTLDFEPGITCVVGPNGSGKSNVVDALSWVMGEQGAKTLRGAKMEDVIFAGTSSRAPLGRAEVVLTIDNTDGALPIEFTEVSIARTMFRNGGSEYAINGSPARLLDVQELLSDSGIGREMHVIVGQGRLDSVLQATPESRRGFIEEAAGILKHRKRKEKAVRKLEATKANVERLTDLIAEIRRQLRPLGRQAEVARKAAVVQAELRDAKARLMADDLVQATDALAAELADEQAAKAAYLQAEQAVAAAQEAETRAEAETQSAAAELAKAQELWYGVAALRERVATIKSIASERMRYADVAPGLDFGGRDPETLEADAHEISQQESELRKETEQANIVLTEATIRRNAIEARHASAEQRFAEAQRMAADQREGLAKLQGKIGSLVSRLQASAEEVGRLQRRSEEAQLRADDASRSFHAQEVKLAGLGNSESDLDQNYEAAAAELSKLKLRSEELKTAEATANQRRAALSARLEALKLGLERKNANTDVASSGRTEVLGMASTLLSVEPGWETALSSVLGVAAEGVVVETHPAAIQIINELQSSDQGRASLIVGDALGSVPEHRQDWLINKLEPGPLSGAMTQLLAGVVCAENLDAALKILQEEPDLSVVMRDGTLINSALVVGGSAAKPSLIELQAAICEAESELANVCHDGERIRFAVSEHAQLLTQASELEQAALAKLHESDAELAALADQMAQYRQIQGSALQEVQRLTEAIQQTELIREQDQASLQELEARLASAFSEEDIVEPDSTERDELAEKARIERQKEMEARLALRTAEERVKALAGRADALLRAAATQRQARAKAKAKAERQRREAEVAQAVYAGVLVLSEQVETVRERATHERDLAEQRKANADTCLTSARNRTREVSQTLDAFMRSQHRDEMVRIEQRMRLESLTDKALSELGLDPQVLMDEYGPHLAVPVLINTDGTVIGPDDPRPDPMPYDRKQQSARLRKAERDLAVLGKINPLALEEYDALSARHTFLAEQLEDIKSTRKDLLDLIDEVDAKVEQVFTEAYRDVETTFEEVFARLFPGGQGRLVLTEPNDWLNTGVDVEASPAGKQVKRLSLLSGGERSLVAVAFLVSLFIARPSPFYILDEVEAALDDVNLSRLLSIYTELRESSQLLIITHQKRTMEIADALYGVTMRGDGISTVISQRLHDET